jgi:hypothetical protein
MPIFLWSYPAEPPEAKASSSQKPCSCAMVLAMSEKVAVPLSAGDDQIGIVVVVAHNALGSDHALAGDVVGDVKQS